MWPFSNKTKRLEALAKEQDRAAKMTASHIALIEAATTTADAAHHISTKLRQCLQDALRLFEASTNILTDGLIICGTDGKIRAFNPAAERIFACAKENLSYLTISEFFLVNGTNVDTNNLLAEFETISTGIVGLRQNGEQFPIEFKTVKLKQSDGSTVVLVLVRDMSMCNIGELPTICPARISEAEYIIRYHALSDITHDGILIVQNGTIFAANPAAGELFGQNKDDLKSKALTDLILTPPGNSSKNVETSGVHKDGTEMQLLLSTTSIVWNGEPATLIAIKNICDIKRMEKLARKFGTNQP